MYFVYIPESGLITDKVIESYADELISANVNLRQKIKCPDDHDTVNYIKVIDGVCIAETQADIDAELFVELRVERNRKLAASDWTQVPDAPVDQEAWKVYRQALRDLPANTTDPENPVWPTKPV